VTHEKKGNRTGGFGALKMEMEMGMQMQWLIIKTSAKTKRQCEIFYVISSRVDATKRRYLNRDTHSPAKENTSCS